jgi:hypothetical protein
MIENSSTIALTVPTHSLLINIQNTGDKVILRPINNYIKYGFCVAAFIVSFGVYYLFR